MKAVVKILKPFSSNIYFASKKDLHFVDKVRDIVKRIDSRINFKVCYNNFNFKILDIMAKLTPRDLAND